MSVIIAIIGFVVSVGALYCASSHTIKKDESEEDNG